ncbi:unnamed protein product [Musa acuminata subsp. malaccensis]|uniref:(wild Malaysian banana) hypothetical protein n=1 Tax=Musa acuminata subsp. malaccensis TaxID=214687 RepID=A0A804IXK8_MUSAM|nr:unnamed protein product [Musa acuminata subsp. malaccensis]
MASLNTSLVIVKKKKKLSVDQRLLLPFSPSCSASACQKPSSYRPSPVIDVGPQSSRNHSNPWPNRYESQFARHVGWHGPKRRREEWRRSCC